MATDGHAAELPPDPISPEAILSGAPEAGDLLLRSFEGWTLGIWEISPGVIQDTELDEVFVILRGRATVECSNGEELSLHPGVVGSFAAGTETVWRIHETLRKVYWAKG
jgi:uncharacterized cupin superfamily protein